MLINLQLKLLETVIKISGHSYLKDLYFSSASNLKQVAITFDDGPDEFVTPRILDALKLNEVKATFFLVGKMAFKYPDVVKRIASEGHVIANHTWSHPRISGLTSEQIEEEVTRTDEFLAKLLGYHPVIFRPPYGIVTIPMLKVLTEMGYKTVIWTVDSEDWAGISAPEIIKNVQRKIDQGGIILQHSSSNEGIDVSNTIHALPRILELLKNKGYTVVTIPKLLNFPEKNPWEKLLTL